MAIWHARDDVTVATLPCWVSCFFLKGDILFIPAGARFLRLQGNAIMRPHQVRDHKTPAAG